MLNQCREAWRLDIWHANTGRLPSPSQWPEPVNLRWCCIGKRLHDVAETGSKLRTAELLDQQLRISSVPETQPSRAAVPTPEMLDVLRTTPLRDERSEGTVLERKLRSDENRPPRDAPLGRGTGNDRDPIPSRAVALEEGVRRSSRGRSRMSTRPDNRPA